VFRRGGTIPQGKNGAICVPGCRTTLWSEKKIRSSKSSNAKKSPRAGMTLSRRKKGKERKVRGRKGARHCEHHASATQKKQPFGGKNAKTRKRQKKEPI